MNTGTHHSPETRQAAPEQQSTEREPSSSKNPLPPGGPADFVPLHLETRTHVSTAVMCRHLGRAQQTARGWASAETFPDGLRPVRVRGRLGWPVDGIRRALGVTA